jgi:hypothetical protein
LNACAASAVPKREAAMTPGAANAPLSTWRRLMIMVVLLGCRSLLS